MALLGFLFTRCSLRFHLQPTASQFHSLHNFKIEDMNDRVWWEICDQKKIIDNHISIFQDSHFYSVSALYGQFLLSSVICFNSVF